MEEAIFNFENIKQYASDIVKYSDDRIIVIDGPHALGDMRIHSEAYIVILCTKGSALSKNDDGADMEIKPNDLVLCHPDQFFERIRTSLDFWCEGVLFAPEYFEQLLLLCSSNVYAKRVIGINPIVHLEPDEAEEMARNLDYLKFKINSPHTGAHHTEMMDCLLQALIFSTADMIVDRLVPGDCCHKFSSGQNLINNFIELVEKETPKLREVKTYADMLCVTPKYLSSVCRRETGKTASEFINSKVNRKIRMLLSNPSLTVKQVAERCGFENLSFFGKYVKREFGLSPRGLRAE